MARLGNISQVNLDPKNYYARLRDAAKRKVGLTKRATNIRAEFDSHLKPAIKRELESSDAIRSLRGNGSVDLQAHFGIDADTANQAANDLVNTISSIITLKFKPAAGDLLGTFSADFGVDIQALKGQKLTLSDVYRSLEDTYQYMNTGRIKVMIRWMKWMLNPNNGPTGVRSNYGIKMDNLSYRQRRASRTGRAVMVKRGDEYVEYPYKLPDVLRPMQPGSRNFIEDVFKDPVFVAFANEVLSKAVRRVVLRRQRG